MNIPQNLPTAFPFWHTPETTGTTNWEATCKKQTFRHSYCDIDPVEIAIQVRYDRFVPMVVEIDEAPTKVFLVEYDSANPYAAIPNECADVTALFSFSSFSEDGRDFIEFFGNTDINQATTFTAYSDKFAPGGVSKNWSTYVRNRGLYFLILEFSDTRMYSELFQLVDFPEFSLYPDDECHSRLRIECVNLCAIGDLPATVNASQKLFVKNPTSTPEYPSERSVATDGKKEEKITWAKVKKRWKVSFNVTEPVADFCSTIPLFSSYPFGVIITDTYGVSGAVKDVEVGVSWPDELGGCLARIDLFFTREFTDFENCC